MTKPPDRPKGRPQAPAPVARRAPMTARDKIVLALFGIVFAFLMVFSFEGVLRLAHYGPDLSVFKQTTILGQKYWELNRDVSLRFFPQGMAKPPGFARFPAVKAPGTYRVFTLGESSTAGDPYGAEASFSAFLQAMLEDQHPGRTVEVVNCGIVAISSTDVLDMVPEILKHEPDAILIYAGHNEAYGADAVLSGVRGTVDTRWQMKGRIRVRNSKIGRLVQDLTHKAKASKGAAPQGFGMELMQGKVLPRESGLHARMLDIFRGNLEEMITRAGKKNVDVILCTLISNQRDQSPLGSQHARGFKQQADFDRNLASAKAAMDARAARIRMKTDRPRQS